MRTIYSYRLNKEFCLVFQELYNKISNWRKPGGKNGWNVVAIINITIISPMIECGCMDALQLSILPVPTTYLGWMPGRYSFMHSMSQASTSGRAYTSAVQTTANVLQLEGSPWSQLFILSGEPTILAFQFSLGRLLSSNAMASQHWFNCVWGLLTLQEGSFTLWSYFLILLCV